MQPCVKLINTALNLPTEQAVSLVDLDWNEFLDIAYEMVAAGGVGVVRRQ